MAAIKVGTPFGLADGALIKNPFVFNRCSPVSMESLLVVSSITSLAWAVFQLGITPAHLQVSLTVIKATVVATAYPAGIVAFLVTCLASAYFINLSSPTLKVPQRKSAQQVLTELLKPLHESLRGSPQNGIPSRLSALSASDLNKFKKLVEKIQRNAPASTELDAAYSAMMLSINPIEKAHGIAVHRKSVKELIVRCVAWHALVSSTK